MRNPAFLRGPGLLYDLGVPDFSILEPRSIEITYCLDGDMEAYHA